MKISEQFAQELCAVLSSFEGAVSCVETERAIKRALDAKLYRWYLAKDLPERLEALVEVYYPRVHISLRRKRGG